MGAIEVIAAEPPTDDRPYRRSGHRLSGGGVGRLVQPEAVPLWLMVCEVSAGARLVWPGDHGDEALWVISGRLAVNGKQLVAEAAAVIEASAPATAVAETPTRFIHVGSQRATGVAPTPGAGRGAGGGAPGVHAVGPRGLYATSGPGNDARFYAESTCATCRPTLFFARRGAPYQSPRHSHSQDELTYIAEGEMVLEGRPARAGDVIAVAANTAYHYRIGPDGVAFVNYHPDASRQWLGDDRPLVTEGGAVNGFEPVMDLL